MFVLSMLLVTRRALEARKRAMEEAEEERRRRALEERRRTQREATERCKMAISRLRLSSRTSSSTTTNSRQRHMPVESESINACVFHFRVLRKLNTIIMCIYIIPVCSILEDT